MKKTLAGLAVLLSVAFINTVSAQSVSNTLSDVFDSAPGSMCTTLTYNMTLGARDSRTAGQVSDLQAYLQAEGHLESDPTGYFGGLTRQAVMRFQTANRISPTGQVGPLTRAKIQTLSCDGTSVGSPIITGVSVSPSSTGELIATFRGLNLNVVPLTTVTLSQNGSIVSTVSVNYQGTVSANAIYIYLSPDIAPGTYQAVLNTFTGPFAGPVTLTVPPISSTVTSTPCPAGFYRLSNGTCGCPAGTVVAMPDGCRPATTTATTTTTTTGRVPDVSSFTASPFTVTRGQSTRLSWNVPTATYCSLQATGYSGAVSGGDKDVSQADRSFTPTENTVYRLTCGNSVGAAEKNIIVTVVGTSAAAATITSFENQADASGAQILSWRTSAAANVVMEFDCGSSNISMTRDQDGTLQCGQKNGVKTWTNASSGSVRVANNTATTAMVSFTLTVLDTSGNYTNQRRTIVVPVVGTQTTTSSVSRPTTASVTVSGLTNGAVLKNGTFRVDWAGNNNPTTYNMMIAGRTLNGLTASFWENTPASLSLDQGSYSIYVQACNSAGCSSWPNSPQATFIVTESQTILDSSVAPTSASFTGPTPFTNGAILRTQPLAFTWSGNNNPTSYKIKISNTVHEVGSATSWNRTPESLGLINGLHTASVQACNARGCSPDPIHPQYSFTVTDDPTYLTVSSVPTNPWVAINGSGGSPMASVALNTPMTISWGAYNAPTSYVLRVNNTEHTQAGKDSWQVSPSSLQLGIGQHTMSVKACNARGCSSYSPILPFSVVDANVTAPTLVVTMTPSVVTSRVDYPFSLSWRAEGASWYSYRVNGASATTIGLTSRVENTPQLLGMGVGTYLFEVQACTNASNGVFCGPWAAATIVVEGGSGSSSTGGSTGGTGGTTTTGTTGGGGTSGTTNTSTVPGSVSISVSPSTRGMGDSLTVTISGAGTSNASNYNMRLVGNGVDVTRNTGDTTTSWSVTPSALGIWAGTWTFYIQACNSSGCSAWSAGATLNVTGNTALNSSSLGAVLGIKTMCVDLTGPLLHLEKTDVNSNGNVTKLQTFLAGKGLLDKVTGYYGRLTRDAVILYQSSKGIDATGNVGESTQSAIKKETCQ